MAVSVSCAADTCSLLASWNSKNTKPAPSHRSLRSLESERTNGLAEAMGVGQAGAAAVAEVTTAAERRRF